MTDLRARAHELRTDGLTPRRIRRRLEAEYPNAERFDIHDAAGLGPTGLPPLWADLSNPIRPVICRIDPRPNPTWRLDV